jgi:hypothetical protein
MAGDGTASGAFAIQDGIPATEWVSPGADFTLNSSSQAKYVGLYISGYAYDFEYVSRGLSNWSMGAYQYPYAVSSGIVDGLLFSSGVLGTTSLYGSGILTPVYLSSMPMMLLKEETTTSGTFNKGLFSITVQSQIKDPWNFYLEAIHSIVSGVPTYVTYTASGSCVNQYGFYKELLELHAGLTDMESLRNQGVMWAQTVSGTYITSRIPVYFRKQS